MSQVDSGIPSRNARANPHKKSTSTSSSGNNLMDLVHEAGFKGQAANTMYAIVMAESGGNATAHNTNSNTGDNSYGLAQINMLGSMGPARLAEYGLSSNNDLFNPLTNLKVAYRLSGGGTNFSPWTTYTRGTYQQYLGQSGATVHNSGSATGAAMMDAGSSLDGRMGKDDFKGTTFDGDSTGLGTLLDSVPELSRIVDLAVSGNWSAAKFQNAVEDSDWWNAHSSSARTAIIQKANDPATYNETLQQTVSKINELSGQLGMKVNGAQANAIATSAMLAGNTTDTDWLTQQISSKENYSKLTSLSSLDGGMAQTAAQIQQLANDYGHNWSAAQIAENAQRVVSGQTTVDTYKNQLQSWAESTFPGLSTQIADGSTVKDLADPYFQSMSNLLEVDPGSLNLYTPAIRKALQGSVDPTTKQMTTQPLWQFENEVRQDPRWQYTQNATDTMSTALLKIGSDFGFGV